MNRLRSLPERLASAFTAMWTASVTRTGETAATGRRVRNVRAPRATQRRRSR